MNDADRHIPSGRWWDFPDGCVVFFVLVAALLVWHLWG